MHKDLITAEEARQLFDYDRDTGDLRWRIRGRKLVSCRDKHGYLVVRVNYRLYRAHRVAWLLHHGVWPESLIDHINGVPSDNRIVNLRVASYAQNNCNRRVNSSNSSGFKGVSYDIRRNKWVSKIKHKGKWFNLGRHDTPEKAHAAYCAAAKDLHREFARLV